MEKTATTHLSNKEYLIQLNRKAAESRIPLSGVICLTNRCNLRCVHCYLGDRSSDSASLEMVTKQILTLIDQIAEAGCLYLLFTGGEPLLRNDFSEIYSHTKNRGIIPTVFSNGTLISKKILELFVDMPPRAVEISLYGATEETYEKITGARGSFRKCIDSIKTLIKHKINVRIKTILMTLNSHEFFAIEAIAKEFGVKFRFDASIFPSLNSDPSPISFRVKPEEAVEKEFSDSERAGHWREYFERTKELPSSGRLYNCAAGVTGFYIDPYGSLRPCLMTSDMSYNILESGFMNGWLNIIPGIRDRKTDINFTCNNCGARHLCGLCPAFFRLETGSENVHSEYLCKIGSHRLNMLNKEYMEGVHNAL